MEPRLFNFSFLLVFFVFSGHLSFSQSDTLFFKGNMYTRVDPPASTYDHVPAEIPEASVISDSKVKETHVDIRAVRDFRKHYPTISDPVWISSPKGYVARFFEDNIQTSVTYSPSGKWQNSIKRYEEASLPKDIRKRIKPVYYDYLIVIVYEIQWDKLQEPVFYIHLQDEITYKIVEVSCDDMREVQSFQMQKKTK